MDLDKTLQRYAIVSAYINDQTDESWERMKATIRRLEGHDDDVFREAVTGLVEFYPELEDEGLVADIQVTVVIPDTGNQQADYENVRDQVERAVKDKSRPRVKCVRVEYDMDYWGSDYSGVGRFACIPHHVLDRLPGKDLDRKLKTAFTVLVGDPVHIVHYSWDEPTDQDGEEWREE